MTALTIIGITVTFMFHSFFNSLARSKYFSLFSISFMFTLWSVGTEKSTNYHHYYCCCCCCFTSWEFFTSVSTYLSQESKWQQVFTGLLDSSKYSKWSYNVFSFTLFFYTMVYEMAKSIVQLVPFFCRSLSLVLVVKPRFGDLFVSQNRRKVFASHFQGWILSCAYTTCLYREI